MFQLKCIRQWWYIQVLESKQRAIFQYSMSTRHYLIKYWPEGCISSKKYKTISSPLSCDHVIITTTEIFQWTSKRRISIKSIFFDYYSNQMWGWMSNEWKSKQNKQTLNYQKSWKNCASELVRFNLSICSTTTVGFFDRTTVRSRGVHKEQGWV